MRVLIAEDNAFERRVLQRAVEDFGHECLTAADGGEAWRTLQHHGADVVISDWMMPELTGVELCRRVRAQIGAPYVYLILLTVLDDREHTRHGMQAGADDYLRKPLDAAELEARLIAAARLTELHRDLARREATREAALRLAERLAAEGRPDQLLAGLLAEAAVLLEGTGALISLWDDEHGVLVPLRSTIPSATDDARRASGQAAIARAVERRAPVVANPYADIGREPGPTLDAAAVAAPLIHEGRLLGALAVVSHAAGRRFTPEDGQILLRLASVGAAALVGLDRARLAGAADALRGVEHTMLTAPATRPRHNLPAQPAQILGRDAELEQVITMLARPEVRLVTLTGTGGVGKTRLAVAVGARVAESGEHDVRMVDLSRTTDAGSVLASVGQVLAGRAGATPESIAQALGGGPPTLLILDNFEHVLGAVDDLHALVDAVPTLQVLITSRAALGLRREHVLPVLPLPVPEGPACVDAVRAAASPAVAVFVQRAQAANPRFAITEQNAAAIAEICARLDGLPLAIELAAGSATVLSPEGIAQRLRRGLGLLPGIDRDRPARHQTLDDAIAWSYALLDPAQQRVFRHLGVFAGGIDPGAAAAVALEPGATELDALAALTTLAGKSLIARDAGPGAEPRFSLLGTIRAYARRQLEQAGEAVTAHQRHAAFFADLAEEANEQLAGPAALDALARLDQERDDLTAALEWTAVGAGSDVGVRLVGALGRYWVLRGEGAGARRWVDRALGWSGAAQPALKASVSDAAARLAFARDDWRAARPAALESLAVWRHLDDRARVADSLALLSAVRLREGARSAAAALAREAAAVAEQVGTAALLAAGRYAQGEVALSQGNYAAAHKHFTTGLALRAEGAPEWQTLSALESLADVAAARGEADRALQIAAAAAHWRRALELPPIAFHAEIHQRRLLPARAALDDAQQATAWAAGSALTLDAAVAIALRPDEPGPTGAHEGAGSAVRWLTRRERDVAALIGLGLHNHEIATRLGIAVHTVEVHVSHVLSKLSMTSRAQLAVWAVDQGLTGPRPTRSTPGPVTGT